MKIIYWPQNFGKTTALVEEAQRAGGVIIAKSEASMKYINGKWPDVEVCTINDMIRGVLLENKKPVLIDDADALLKMYVAQYTAGPLAGFSITMDRPY